MFERILAMYWTPKGTPLWKHHLPSLLIGTVLLAFTIFSGLQNVTALLPMFCVLVASQVAFGYLARKRFGDKNPRPQD
jgi:CDP-diglyceride synthetase